MAITSLDPEDDPNSLQQKLIDKKVIESHILEQQELENYLDNIKKQLDSTKNNLTAPLQHELPEE